MQRSEITSVLTLLLRRAVVIKFVKLAGEKITSGCVEKFQLRMATFVIILAPEETVHILGVLFVVMII